MKIIFTTIALTILSQSHAFAQSERAAEEAASVELSSLKVKTENTVTGDINATNNSTVKVGDTEITNTEAGNVDIDLKNTVKGITAEDDSTVSLGSVRLNNVEAGDIKIKADNVVDGELTAVRGSTVSVGSTDLSNLKTGNVDISSKNRVKNITAEDNSHVKIGTTTTN